MLFETGRPGGDIVTLKLVRLHVLIETGRPRGDIVTTIIATSRGSFPAYDE